jgi:hypothetical protein
MAIQFEPEGHWTTVYNPGVGEGGSSENVYVTASGQQLTGWAAQSAAQADAGNISKLANLPPNLVNAGYYSWTPASAGKYALVMNKNDGQVHMYDGETGVLGGVYGDGTLATAEKATVAAIGANQIAYQQHIASEASKWYLDPSKLAIAAAVVIGGGIASGIIGGGATGAAATGTAASGGMSAAELAALDTIDAGVAATGLGGASYTAGAGAVAAISDAAISEGLAATIGGESGLGVTAAEVVSGAGAGITDEMLLTGTAGLGDLGVGTGVEAGWTGAVSAGATGGLIQSIGDVISGKVFGGGIAGSLISTALTGLLLNVVESALTPKTKTESSTAPGTSVTDNGQQSQVEASPTNKIPVLYGKFTFAGIITDAVMSNNNQHMAYVLTLSEKTGTTILGVPSTYTFHEVRWADSLINFGSDGVTAIATTDRQGVSDTKINGLVKVRLYAGSSSSIHQLAPSGYSITPVNAYNITALGWDSTKTMNDLIFAVVELDYSRDNGIVSLPQITFTIRNSMDQPGDVLFDYMTNTRYGAAIPSEEIYSQ